MKKLVLGLISVVILFLLFIYLFIPSRIRISAVSMIHCPINQVAARLQSAAEWKTWWQQEPGADSVFSKQGSAYSLSKPLTNGADIRIVSLKHDTIMTNIFLMSQGKDSTQTEWRTEIPASFNPVTRIKQYYKAVALQKDLKSILDMLKEYAGKTENIYGIDPKPEKVQFEFYMSLKKTFSHEPTITDIYSMIDAVREFLVTKGVKELDHPMVNITHTESTVYLAEVALPTDKKLGDEGEFIMKWMLKGGNMLVAEVKGGNYAVSQSLKQFTQYMNDRHLTIMAIPFQSLVTDRRSQPDSSQWITKLYYPVL